MFKPFAVIIRVFLFYLVSCQLILIPKVKAQESESLLPEKICTQEDLATEIEQILNQVDRRSENWGILVEKLNNSEIIYQLNQDKYFIPASNTKLLTTASILLQINADFTIKTPVYSQGKKQVLDKLIIVGKGDPTLKKEDLNKIISKLQEQEIIFIKNIILVDHYLPEPIINYSWEFSDVYYFYAVPINSLILDDNIVTLTLKPDLVDRSVLWSWSDENAGKQWQIENQAITAPANSEDDITLKPSYLKPKLTIVGTLARDAKNDNWWLSIPQPAQYFQDTLEDILTKHKIGFFASEIIYYQNYLQNNLDSDKQLLLEFISPPLKELITITNQNSDNLYAEVLFKYLAVDDRSLNPSESLKKILTNEKINVKNINLKDGSGLSRQNLLTPRAIVSILKLMNQSKYREVYRNSLAIAGEKGTLKRRFLDSPVEGKLLGKTGTLTGVSALSGYLMLDNYDDLVISIIVNESTANAPTLRQTIDRIVRLVSQLDNCSYSPHSAYHKNNTLMLQLEIMSK